jgi:predicted HicB family RNase H-like nuclease
VAKDKILNIRIDPDLKKQAKKLAQDEGRSLSNWVTWLINRELKRAGKKPGKQD